VKIKLVPLISNYIKEAEEKDNINCQVSYITNFITLPPNNILHHT
jgi:hypothetical protein